MVWETIDWGSLYLIYRILIFLFYHTLEFTRLQDSQEYWDIAIEIRPGKSKKNSRPHSFSSPLCSSIPFLLEIVGPVLFRDTLLISRPVLYSDNISSFGFFISITSVFGNFVRFAPRESPTPTNRCCSNFRRRIYNFCPITTGGLANNHHLWATAVFTTE